MGLITEFARDYREAVDIWRGKLHHVVEAGRRSFPHAMSTDYGRWRKEFSGTPRGRSMAAESNTFVNRCIEYIINEVKNVDWWVEDEEGNRIEEHPFIAAEEYLWVKYQQDFFSRWITMKLVHGNVYIEKFVKGRRRRPSGLLILNSQYISPNIGDGGIIDYAYNISDGSSTYGVDEVFTDLIPALQSDLVGKSPVDRALAHVNIDQLSFQTIRSFLKNDNKPSGILVPYPGERYSIAAMKEILTNFHEQGMGPDGGYRTKMLPGAFNLETFAAQLPDLMIPEKSQKSICVEFGIDPALIGASITMDPLGASTTLQEKRVIALINVIRPNLKYFQKYINTIILPWLAPGVVGKFTWDYNTVDRMIKYSMDAVEQARKDVHGGLMSINEYRELRALPPVPDGDVLMMPEGGGTFKIIDFNELSSVTHKGGSGMLGNLSDLREDVKLGLMTLNEYRELRDLPALPDGEILITEKAPRYIDKDDLDLITEDEESMEQGLLMAENPGGSENGASGAQNSNSAASGAQNSAISANRPRNTRNGAQNSRNGPNNA